MAAPTGLSVHDGPLPVELVHAGTELSHAAAWQEAEWAGWAARHAASALQPCSAGMVLGALAMAAACRDGGKPQGGRLRRQLQLPRIPVGRLTPAWHEDVPHR